MERRDAYVTPEAVAVTVDAAGLGSRMIASMIDSLIQGALFGVIALIVGGIGSGTAAVVVLSIGAFVVLWGYYPAFEGLGGGRTPGKRAQRLRVVRTDGQPATLGPVLVRNVLRVVDFLPGFYGIGVTAMLLTRRSQRVGDLAAGTMVVRESRDPQPAPLVLNVDARVDTAGINQREYVLIRNFLQRRDGLTPEARAQIAAQLSGALRDRIAGGPASDEAFLEAVAASFRGPAAGPPAPSP